MRSGCVVVLRDILIHSVLWRCSVLTLIFPWMQEVGADHEKCRLAWTECYAARRKI